MSFSSWDVDNDTRSIHVIMTCNVISIFINLYLDKWGSKLWENKGLDISRSSGLWIITTFSTRGQLCCERTWAGQLDRTILCAKIYWSSNSRMANSPRRKSLAWTSLLWPFKIWQQCEKNVRKQYAVDSIWKWTKNLYWSSICFVEHEVYTVLNFAEIQVISRYSIYLLFLFSHFTLFNNLCIISCIHRVVPASMNEPLKLKLKVPSVTIVPDCGIPLRFIPREEWVAR